MTNGISIYENETSEKEVRAIEAQHFCFFFQGMLQNGDVDRCYYRNGKIVARDLSGNIVEDII